MKISYRDILLLGEKYMTLLEKRGHKDILDRSNYIIPYDTIKRGQFIGDLMGGNKIKAVYVLLSDSDPIELPSKAGGPIIQYRARCKRIDTKEPEYFEGGTVKDNFVLLSKKEARAVIKELRKLRGIYR